MSSSPEFVNSCSAWKVLDPVNMMCGSLVRLLAFAFARRLWSGGIVHKLDGFERFACVHNDSLVRTNSLVQLTCMSYDGGMYKHVCCGRIGCMCGSFVDTEGWMWLRLFYRR